MRLLTSKVIDLSKEKWFLKSLFTIVASQIGILIILIFVGPSKEISFTESFSNYLLKGSLFLSSVSIAANLISVYFFDKRKENEDLVFEINKSGLGWLIVIISSAGISYSILPETYNLYFIFVQIGIFAFLIYWVFKINHIVQNKKSYSQEFDEKGNKAMVDSKQVNEHNGVSL